jgi:hypothetical protein
MDGITFWVVALGIPSVTVGLNAVVRGVLRRPQTTGADFVLALIAFDAVVLADPGEFRQWVVLYRSVMPSARYLSLSSLSASWRGSGCCFWRENSSFAAAVD